MLTKVGKALRIISDEKKEKIALLLDGASLLPNFQITNLKKLKDTLSEIGTTKVGIFFIDQTLTEKESIAITAQGFREEIVGSDIDMHITVNSLEFMNNKLIDIIGIASTNPILFPVFSRIKQEKKLLIITWKKDVSSAIESIADYILYLDFLT